MDRPGYDLHRVTAASVATDVCKIGPTVDDMTMPSVERCSIQRLGDTLVKIDHHLGDAGFGRLDPTLIPGEPQVPADRGLDAVAIERLSFDRRGVDGLMAHQLDLKAAAVSFVQMS